LFSLLGFLFPPLIKKSILCSDDPRDLQGQLEDDLKRARLLHYESHNPSPGGGGGGGYPGMWTTTSSALAATTPTIIGGGGSRWSPSTPPGIKEEKQQHLTVGGGVGLTDLHSPSGGAPHSGHSPSGGGGMHSPSSYPPPSFADSIVFTAAPPPPNTTSGGAGTGDILYDTINMSQSAYTPISHSGKQKRYF
jgi:hypothetical protein